MNIFAEMKKFDFFTKRLGGDKFADNFSTNIIMSEVIAPSTFTKIASFTPRLNGVIGTVNIQFSSQDGNAYSGTISIQIKNEKTGSIIAEKEVSYSNTTTALSSITFSNIDVEAYNGYGIYYKNVLPTSTSVIKYYPSKINIAYTVGTPRTDYVKLNPFKE